MLRATFARSNPHWRLRLRDVTASEWEAPLSPGKHQLPAEFTALLPVELRNRSGQPSFAWAKKAMDFIRDTWPFHIYGAEDFTASAYHFDLRKFLAVMQRQERPVQINCGSYVHLFCAVCESAAIAARVVVAGNREATMGHLIAEVWDDEKNHWVAVDLLYNAWFERDGRLSASALQDVVKSGEDFAIKRGNAKLDWYCTPERLCDYLRKGILETLIFLKPGEPQEFRLIRKGYRRHAHD
jgi:hypothetical protein